MPTGPVGLSQPHGMRTIMAKFWFSCYNARNGEFSIPN